MKDSCRGVSLIEVLVVIAIIAVLVAMILPASEKRASRAVLGPELAS